MRRKLLEGKNLEHCTLALFILTYLVVTIFHEPWFDEAQAWQIAKCANLSTILFEVPHYEGHPALWFLILAIPAKLGIPFEVGLKSVGFVFSLISVYLIIYKMPYPRMMRILMPFTFFVFYQYGIVVRPYVLTMFALLLLALHFPTRYELPWKYIGLLIFLCLTSAYGIVIAGGIALCMVYELINQKGISRFFRELFSDQRTFALGTLLVTAIIIILQIMPKPNTWVTSSTRINSFFLCLCCAIFSFMEECLLTTSSWFNRDRVLLQNTYINTPEFIILCMIGAMLWVMLVCASSKKALKYYVVPYSLLAIFASLVYFSVHHVGIILLLLLFWTGILFQDENRYEIGRKLSEKIATSPKDKLLIKRMAIAICIVFLLVPMYWCLSASINDVKLEYSYGRSGSRFLVDHELDNSVILSDWGESGTKIVGMNSTEYRNIYEVGIPVLLNAYFDHNICLNLNNGNDNEAYMHYKIPVESEILKALASWQDAGIPNVILGKPELSILYGDTVNYSEYTLVNIMQIHYIWKNTVTGGYCPIYARNDILDSHNLEPYNEGGYKYFAEGIPITKEMIEQIENGVPVEEILKPYLDAMFGEQK